MMVRRLPFWFRRLGNGWLVVCMAGALAVSGLAAEPQAPTTADSRAAPPPWAGSPAGKSDELLPPWTPVEVVGSTVKVWGRTYTFGALPFPRSVVTRDAEVLSAPVTLEGTSGGKPLAWKAGSCRIAESTPSRARLAIQAEGDPIRCEGTVLVEYDGMVRCDVRLVPTQADVPIDRLALVIPLRTPHAKYLHFWPGRWGSAYNSTALPQEGFRGPFKPFFWLGDEWRGLGWFVESDRNFVGNDPGSVIEVQRQDESVLWRINLIGAVQTVREPLEYTFGLQATPVKAARPDAWDYRICHMGNYGIEDRPPGLLDQLAKHGVRTICFHEHWTDIQNYPKTTHGDKLRKLVAACHERGIQLLLYHGYEMSTIAPEWDQYHEECLVAPRAGGYKRKPEQTAYIVCYRSHWQDFLADGIDKLMDEYGIDGVYLDGTSEPWGCANRRHGCGYVRPDGSIAPTYPMFATREMMRRIYTIVKKHHANGQVNVHQSTCMVIPTLAFATSYWDGEQLQSVARPASPQDVLPLDAFRAEFMGHNWGVPAELLWYGSGPFKRVESMSVALLHDVPVRPSSMADVEIAGRMWRAFDELGRHEAVWLPYWENQAYVAASPAHVKVSLYNRPRKGAILVAANLAQEDCRAQIQLNLSALEQPSALTATDIVTGAPVPVTEGRLEVSLPSMHYAMIRLQP